MRPSRTDRHKTKTGKKGEERGGGLEGRVRRKRQGRPPHSTHSLFTILSLLQCLEANEEEELTMRGITEGK